MLLTALMRPPLAAGLLTNSKGGKAALASSSATVSSEAVEVRLPMCDRWVDDVRRALPRRVAERKLRLRLKTEEGAAGGPWLLLLLVVPP